MSMTSTSTVAYGLTVRAADLYVASLAWNHLSKPFEFFDLLFLRIRKDNLVSKPPDSGGAALKDVVKRVPNEVWQEVRDQLVGIELERAERTLFENLRKRCKHPQGSHQIGSRVTVGLVDAWASICSSCRGSVNEWFRDLNEGKSAFLTPVHALVSAFGLAHPLERPIANFSWEVAARNGLALVALPLESRGDTTQSTIVAHGGNTGIGFTLASFSVDLPANSDLRLIRFVRMFGLRVARGEIGHLQSTNPETFAQHRIEESRQIDERDYGKMMSIEGFDGQVLHEIKPSWKLYTCYVD